MPVQRLSGETKTVRLGKCHIFRGVHYGPGKIQDNYVVDVPVEFGVGLPQFDNAAQAKVVKQEVYVPADLPEDFPHLDRLKANGVTTVDGVSELDGFEGLSNIGESRWNDIQRALALI